jgi:arsenate reductase
MIQVFGITQCDQVRGARRWLKDHGLAYSFVDLKAAPPSREVLLEWLKHIPFDSLMNRRGKTWRSLPEERRRAVVDQGSAVELMLELPLVIKRPVVLWKDQIAVGFSDALYAGLFETGEANSSNDRSVHTKPKSTKPSPNKPDPTKPNPRATPDPVSS